MDTKGFWDDYWDNNEYGKIKKDPDEKSDSLRRSQMVLYRGRSLPDGSKMDLVFDFKPLLKWNGIKLSSDTIITMLNFKNYVVMDRLKDDEKFRPAVERFMHRIYTIAGEILFPKHSGSINQIRGSAVSDRFDLTLLCIQRYYEGCDSLPGGMGTLLDVIKGDSAFFDAFGDFKGYVDFFFLNDLVDSDYNTVLWVDNTEKPREDEYEMFMRNQMDFFEKRKKRISEYVLPK